MEKFSRFKDAAIGRERSLRRGKKLHTQQQRERAKKKRKKGRAGGTSEPLERRIIKYLERGG